MESEYGAYSYVDKGIVYKDHVEVVFNVVFNTLKDYEAYKIGLPIKKLLS